MRALLRKLEALAEHGIDGERLAAHHKLARLKARYDFAAPAPVEHPDLFSGQFNRSRTARSIYSFDNLDFDVANSVKWAIESATKICCVYRGRTLLAEAAPPTANKLREIANHIASSFQALLDQFGRVDGATAMDRSIFVRGLYDGMMNDSRSAGELLPGALRQGKKVRRVKNDVTSFRLDIHPYTLAVPLGKQIRFSAPLEQIRAELEALTQKQIQNSGPIANTAQ